MGHEIERSHFNFKLCGSRLIPRKGQFHFYSIGTRTVLFQGIKFTDLLNLFFEFLGLVGRYLQLLLNRTHFFHHFGIGKQGCLIQNLLFLFKIFSFLFHLIQCRQFSLEHADIVVSLF